MALLDCGHGADPAGTDDQSPRRVCASEGMGVALACGKLLSCSVFSRSCCARSTASASFHQDPQWVIRARADPAPRHARPTQPLHRVHPPGGETYPGGIPTMINGDRVAIGLDAQAQWRDATQASPVPRRWLVRQPDEPELQRGIGPDDPNPLGARGCPRYAVDGLPGRPFYPEIGRDAGRRRRDRPARPHPRSGCGDLPAGDHRRMPTPRRGRAGRVVRCRRDAGRADRAARGHLTRDQRVRDGVATRGRRQPDGRRRGHLRDPDRVAPPRGRRWCSRSMAIRAMGSSRSTRIAPLGRHSQASTAPEAASDCLASWIERPAGSSAGSGTRTCWP